MAERWATQRLAAGSPSRQVDPACGVVCGGVMRGGGGLAPGGEQLKISLALNAVAGPLDAPLRQEEL